MEFQVLISLAELESIFFETMRQELTLGLSEFNVMQLGILTQKHSRAYCSSIAIDVCYYYCEDKVSHNNLNLASDMAGKNFQSDFTSFLNRFLFWEAEKISDFLQRLSNVLTHTFMSRLEAATGRNIYDNRQYRLRKFSIPQEWTTASDRVLYVTFEPAQVPAVGFSMAG